VHFAELAEFAELTKLMELAELTEKLCTLARRRLSTEHDICGMEYFHWPTWINCLVMLPPSSSTPVH